MNIITDLVTWYQTKQLESTIEIIIAIGIIVGSYICSSIFSYGIIRIFTIADKSKNIKKNAFYKPLKIFFILLGVYIAILILKLPQSIMDILNKGFKVAIICLISKGISNIVSPNSLLFTKLKKNEKFKNNNSLNLISRVLKILVYIITAFVILAEFGYDLNGVITGLGLGSVVIALAAQDIAKSLFAGVVIYFDKPFEIGDLIKVKDFQGTVEDVKFRNTRLRLLDGSMLNIPNEVLMTETITNWNKINKRRYELNLEFMLNTKINKVEKVVQELKQTLMNLDGVIANTVEVNFNEITENGMNVFIYFYTTKTEYNEYLKFKQIVNIEIMKILEKEKVSLAYKSQDIYIRN